MARKQKGPRIGLLINEVRDGEFFHLNLLPVVLDTVQPGSVRNARENFGWSAEPGLRTELFLKDLQITSQSHRTGTGSGHLYAWETVYSGVYRINRETADAMAKTLATIFKRIDRMARTDGHPASYEEYVLRVAKAIGATEILRQVEGTSRWASYDDASFRRYTLAEGRDVLRQIAAGWRSEVMTGRVPHHAAEA